MEYIGFNSNDEDGQYSKEVDKMIDRMPMTSLVSLLSVYLMKKDEAAEEERLLRASRESETTKTTEEAE